MKEIRLPLPDDQENIEKAYQLIMKLMDLHKEIEPTLWAGALFSALVTGYKHCDFSYREFRGEVEEALAHYRKEWE